MAKYERLMRRADRVSDRSYKAARKGKQKKATRLNDKETKLRSKARGCGKTSKRRGPGRTRRGCAVNPSSSRRSYRTKG
tara:strand:- start:725 stop:961 length:237 start_codon:yes stop_codon:yes gene_type:complete